MTLCSYGLIQWPDIVIAVLALAPYHFCPIELRSSQARSQSWLMVLCELSSLTLTTLTGHTYICHDSVGHTSIAMKAYRADFDDINMP